MAFAASRYTEVKLAEICAELFSDIDKNAVDFVENYNGSMKEPVLFPTTFPNILATPNVGIAVGIASSIPSFNLKEICAATIGYIKNSEADLRKFIKGPDFSTGGYLIFNAEENEKIYNSGRGAFRLRAKYRCDQKNSRIEIFEIPYSTAVEIIIDKIVALVKSNKIREINDIRDETDKSGLKIAVDIKRGTDPDLLMKKLFKSTPLEDVFSCNFNVLIDGSPKSLGVKEIIEEWVLFRISCVKRALEFDIKRKSDYLLLLNGLSKVILDIDKAIKIIRGTAEDSLVIPNLTKGFGITQTEAEYVAQIRLRNLNKEYLLNKIKERENLENEIARLRELAGDENKIKASIAEQLKEVAKKYGKPRLTEIISIEEEVVFEEEDYEVKIIFTEENYIKKIPPNFRGAQNLKRGDRILQEMDLKNKCEIIFFSNLQNSYKLKCSSLPDGKAGELGEYLPNLLSLDGGERILLAVCAETGFMIFGFENGKFAKIPINSYNVKQNRKKLPNARRARQKCVFMDFTRDEKDYIIVWNDKKALLFNSELLPETASRDSGGVQVLSFKSGGVKVFPAENFAQNENLEFYRVKKIPGPGRVLLNQIAFSDY
jgi:DNA gyrase subunit A